MHALICLTYYLTRTVYHDARRIFLPPFIIKAATLNHCFHLSNIHLLALVET